MQMRKRAKANAKANANANAKNTATGGLVELLDRLELALTHSSPRTPVCKALFDLNQRLGTGASDKTPVRAKRAKRAVSARRERRVVVESLPLFS